jgi:tetratricopeptide (TPR) repeat protein
MHPELEAYLNGELQGEALEQFEAALATDPALRDEAEMLRPLVRDLRRAGITHRVETAERRRLARRRARRIAIVVVCGVLLCLGGIWRLWKPGQQHDPPTLQQPEPQGQKPSNPTINTSPQQQADAVPAPKNNKDVKKNPTKQLFAAWFKPYKDEKMEPVYRGNSDLTPYERFHIFYWDGQYRDALNTFESLQPFEKSNDNTLFVRANCLLALNRADEAAALLEKISHNKRSRFGAESEWYLALTYLNSGQIPAARALLQTLADSPGVARRQDAAALLKELD